MAEKAKKLAFNAPPCDGKKYFVHPGGDADCIGLIPAPAH
jgi:hypothetical protein